MEYTITNPYGFRMGSLISNLDDVEVRLNNEQLFKLDISNRHARVICTQGTLWVTVEGDLNDQLLSKGETILLKTNGKVILQGLPEAVAQIMPLASKN